MSVERKVKAIRQMENWKKKSFVRDLVSQILQSKRFGRTELKLLVRLNGSRIKRFRKPERSDVDEALLKWFEQERSDGVAVSSPSLTMTSVLPKFEFKVNVF